MQNIIDNIKKLSDQKKHDYIASLSYDEKITLNHIIDNYIYDWTRLARPNQLPPPTDWRIWLILAGRGFGKTRSGAEWVRMKIKTMQYVNIIGASISDARDVMVEGESGIINCCADDEKPRYIASKRSLEWPNGAKTLIFTAEEPERLRGKQHTALWVDELCAWRYPDALDQALLGLRLGSNPQMVITTTPKPSPMLSQIMARDDCVITTGSTYDNAHNLADAFIDQIVSRYEGTNLGRQELYAEILDEIQGALWHRDTMDGLHNYTPPDYYDRVVIGVDPAVTTNTQSDNTGIVVCAYADGIYYVLDDATGKYTPNQWGQKVKQVAEYYQTDCVVCETNQGGDLVVNNLRSCGYNGRVINVRATKGKTLRAEPIAALYEQNKVYHTNKLAQLEDEMCNYTPYSSTSPDRLDAMVWAMTELSQRHQFNPQVYVL